MLNPFWIRLLELNPLAEWTLARQCNSKGMFLCRGKTQLSLHPTAVIKLPNQKTYIGIPIQGNTTPKNTVTVISVESNGSLSLNGATIGRGAILAVGISASLDIANGSYITGGSRVLSQNSITIGKNCAISWGVTIMDDDGHGFGPPPYSAPIVIEDNVWIGCNVTILKGVTIGAGSVVAAGAVVTRSCAPQSLIGGVPARVIRENIQWTDQARIS
jgi:tetrahydrodipicolinate N-succinyltransferase